jgi:ATP-dependent helicase/nuclease subunit A
VKLNPEQEMAATAPGSVVVTAGAGTGKTAMLARRYLHHLRHGLRPLEVVAVTFTRRAAEELRARVRRTVAAALREEPTRFADPDLLAEVEGAPIGTIHALAQIICRRYPEAAEVPPDFSLVDELDAKLWGREALDEALATLPEEDLDAIGYPTLRLALETALDDPTRAKRALAVDPAEVRAHIDARRRAAFANSVGSEAWRGWLGAIGDVAGPPAHAAEQNRRELLARCAELQALGPDGDPLALAEAWGALAKLPVHKGAAKDWEGADLRELKGLMGFVRKSAEAHWDQGRGDAALFWGEGEEGVAAIVARLRGVLERALAIVDARKGRAKALTFADLETHALRALADPGVRAHVQRRWRALLVDEVQDVNPTQAELLAALRADDVPLTAVGDVKQSIYGFRGAEPQVLADLQAEVAREPGGKLVALSRHYRSHEQLVEAIQRVFAGLGDASFAADALRLQAVRRAPAGLPEAMQWQCIDPEPAANAPVRALAEAHAIAATLRGWVTADPPLLIEVEGGRRPLRFTDVAVLARGHTALALLEASLPTEGVPVVNVGGGDLLATQESMDMRALLRAVIDPGDALALAALLRSPYVGASDREIVTFIASRLEGGLPWWRQLERPPRSKAIAHLAELLFELRRQRAAGACASDLCEVADRRCDVRAILANLPQGARRVADHDGMVALLRRLEQGHADALGVVRRLEQLVAAEIEVARPPLRASGAVSLLTMHAAKGLEWPVVVVADFAAPGRSNQAAVLIDPDLGFTLRPPGRFREARPPSPYALAARRTLERELQEARRLAYVAFTRARDLLLISDRGGRNAGLRLALGEALERAGISPRPLPLERAPLAPPPLPPLPDPPDARDGLWRPLAAG